MNESAEVNESVDDILAEMRRRIAVKMGDAWYTQDEWRSLCERLDAALERERDEWRSRLKDAHELADEFLKTANHALDAACFNRHLAEKYMGVGKGKISQADCGPGREAETAETTDAPSVHGGKR